MEKSIAEFRLLGLVSASIEEFTKKFNPILVEEVRLVIINVHGEEEHIAVDDFNITAIESYVDEWEEGDEDSYEEKKQSNYHQKVVAFSR